MPYDSKKDEECCKVGRQALLDEDRLALLDQAIQTERARLIDQLKRISELKVAAEGVKYDGTDQIEEFERIEMLCHTSSMQLAAWCVERSRLVRAIMSQHAAMRELAEEAYSSDEEDVYDPDFEETWAKTAICAKLKCALEEHVKENGQEEVAHILKPGAKFPMPDHRLLAYGHVWEGSYKSV